MSYLRTGGINVTRSAVAAFVLASSLACGASRQPSASSSAPSAHAKGRIVFYNDPLNDDPKQLFIERADGTHRHQLLRSNTDDVSPTISPNGRWVVFTRQRQHGALPDQIFMVRIDGTGVHRVIPGGCPKSATCGDAVEGHAFSPDGTRLVFTRAVFPEGAGAPAYVELWTSDLDGSHPFRLTHESGTAQDDDASWSPDGTKVVFLHWIYGAPDRFRIATIDADGSHLRLVTPAGLDSADPSFSPQGDEILFQSPPDPQNGVDQVLYTVRPDGSELEPVTTHLHGVASNHPSWSPDGRQIVFCHIPPGGDRSDLYLIDRDGTGLRRLSRTPLIAENGVYWGTSPGRS